MNKPSSARMTYRPDSRGKLIREATQEQPKPQPKPQSQEQPKPSVLKGADPSRWKTEVPESLSSQHSRPSTKTGTAHSSTI